MSVATSTAVGLAVAGGTAAASAYGAHKQAGSAKRADQIAQQGNADQLAYLREQSTEDRRRYDQQQQQAAAHYAAKQAQLAPYINAGAAITRRAMGLPPKRAAMPATTPPPGQMTPPQGAGPMAAPPVPGTIGALARSPAGGRGFPSPAGRPVQTASRLPYRGGTIADFIKQRS